jgi:hypothetical protein
VFRFGFGTESADVYMLTLPYGILAGCGGGWWTFAENGLLRRSLMERCHSCREIGEYCSARKMTEFDVSGLWTGGGEVEGVDGVD